MRYIFKKERKKELIGEQKIQCLASHIDITNCYLSQIINMRTAVPFYMAYTIANYLGHNEIEYYFDKVGE